MKPSRNPFWFGCLGLALAAWGGVFFADYRINAVDLGAAFRMGYARPAGRLAKDGSLVRDPDHAEGWLSSLERALVIQFSSADRLRVDIPQDQDLLLLETDVMPQGSYGLSKTQQGWEIRVVPWHGEAWSAPSNSGGAVLPAAYPANGRIAYYDLGRIWIADLNGFKMQSLQHVPLLEQGGEIYWDYGGTRLCWMGRDGGAAAVDLTVENAKDTPQ